VWRLRYIYSDVNRIGAVLVRREGSCAPWGFPAAQTQVRMKLRSIELNADDGKQVKAEW